MAKNVELACKVMAARLVSRVNRSELARRCGVSRSTVYRWELRGGCDIKASLLAKIADACQVPVEWFLSGEELVFQREDGWPIVPRTIEAGE